VSSILLERAIKKKNLATLIITRFNIDEDAMLIEVEMQVRSALEFFNK